MLNLFNLTQLDVYKLGWVKRSGVKFCFDRLAITKVKYRMCCELLYTRISQPQSAEYIITCCRHFTYVQCWFRTADWSHWQYVVLETFNWTFIPLHYSYINIAKFSKVKSSFNLTENQEQTCKVFNLEFSSRNYCK